MELVEPIKIHIGSVHDIDCTRFRNKVIKNVDIMNFAVCDPYESWDVTPQIQEGMQLYGTLGCSKSSPWEDR